MEENISGWHRAKLAKYEDEIQAEAQANGWKFYAFILEVGARGWIPATVDSALKSLGMPSVKGLCDKLTHTALKSSYIIWLNRWNKDFKPWRLASDKELTTLQQHKRKASVSRSYRRNPAPALQGKLSFDDNAEVAQAFGSVRGNDVEQLSIAVGSAGSKPIVIERKVLVDGKWLREGKFSDVQPRCSPATGVAMRAIGSDIESARGNDVEQLSTSVGSAVSKPIAIERKVLVDGKWLREGKLSDVQPRCPPATGVAMCAGSDDPKLVDSRIGLFGGESVASNGADASPFPGDSFEADLQQSDLDAKELIKLVTFSDPHAPCRIPIEPRRNQCLTQKATPVNAHLPVSAVPRQHATKDSLRVTPAVHRQSKLKGLSTLKATSQRVQQSACKAPPLSISAVSRKTASATRQVKVPKQPVSSKAPVLSASAELICSYCQRAFPSMVGLSVHLTRWCTLNPNGAGWARRPGQNLSRNLQSAPTPRQSGGPVIARPQSAPVVPLQTERKRLLQVPQLRLRKVP